MKKQEPSPKAVDIGRVSEIGVHQVHTKTPPPMFKTDGLRAPVAVHTTHKSGSQGKHK